jgi:hypothetical protein
MSNLLLIYSSYDRYGARKKTRTIIDLLEKRGFSVDWRDEDFFSRVSGKKLKEEMSSMLQKYKCFVVLWTRRTETSLQAREIAYLASSQKKLIGVLIERLHQSLEIYPLDDSYMIKLIRWRGSQTNKEFRRLVTMVKNMIGYPDPLGRKELNKISSAE